MIPRKISTLNWQNFTNAKSVIKYDNITNQSFKISFVEKTFIELDHQKMS